MKRNTISPQGNTSWIIPVLLLLAACLLISSLARMGIVAWQWDRVAPTNGLMFILVQGLRFDLVTLGLFFGIPIAFTPLVLSLPWAVNFWRRFLFIYGIVIVGFMLFMELATPSFVSEYDVRPNILFVEYLNHPREVFSMLIVGYKLPLLVLLITLPIVVWKTKRILQPKFMAIRPTKLLPSIVLLPCLLAVAVMAVRSTLDHRPVNPSTVAFASDPLVNSLALNSTYSVLYAIYELRHEDSSFSYGEVDRKQVIAETQHSMGLSPEKFTHQEIPTLHRQQATTVRVRPKNLVIVIEESLGSEFVGSMGGLPLTPNLDSLAKEGMWFENLYATGTRSVRGLEAIITGFLPSTSGSVVKLGNSQQGFFTLGRYLKNQGFDTSFIYGGESQFDNMRRFFANNGFDTIVDKKDYDNPVFFGSWGASDEDLFNKAHDYFSNTIKDKPFFSLVFTSSNHSPFEFPDGRIELYEEPKHTVNNAVKYADHALGEFFEKAKASNYWQDTIFLVISDHNSRVYGAQLVPIERFHIPGLILGADIEPSVVTRLASQIDMLPTLLSIIGVSGEHPATGLDLTRDDISSIPGRAMMQYGNTQGYLEEDRLVVLRKDMSPKQYQYEEGKLVPVKNDPEFIAKAVNLSAWPWVSYHERTYRLPANYQGSGATTVAAFK